jgi:hypothetical protein
VQSGRNPPNVTEERVAASFETSVNVYRTAWRCKLQNENLYFQWLYIVVDESAGVGDRTQLQDYLTLPYRTLHLECTAQLIAPVRGVDMELSAIRDCLQSTDLYKSVQKVLPTC